MKNISMGIIGILMIIALFIPILFMECSIEANREEIKNGQMG